MLPIARQKYRHVLEAAGLIGPCDIQLRELPPPTSTCQVVLYPSPAQMDYLETLGLGLRRDADGVVVVASALSWHALLG